MQVGKYLLDDHWVLNASNQFDSAAAFTARFIGHVLVPDRLAAVNYCAIGCPADLSMSILKTRFNRWA